MLRRVSTTLLALLVAGSVSAQVNLPGTQPADGEGDPAFPAFMDDALPGSLRDTFTCKACHGNYRAFGESIYEPWDSWAGTMMANSARDPLFWAALDIANQDDADVLGGVGVGDLCLRCHVPKAWYEGRSDCMTPWGERFDGSCLEGSIDDEGRDFEGVQCHFCHRMYDAGDPPAGQYRDPAAPYAGNTQVYLSTLEDEMRGPYDDAQVGNHMFAQSTFHTQSSFCGQCHDVTNPVLNRRDPMTGADLGYPMPIERTFREWSQSAYADPIGADHARCQTCHMLQPDFDEDGMIDDALACFIADEPRGPGSPLDGEFRMHAFVGGNTFWLTVLREEYGDLLDRTEHFDHTIAATYRLLQERTADAEITAPATSRAGATVPVSVRITNNTGHKFPTGYPEGRRAWVNLALGEDRDGDTILGDHEVSYESAAYDEATAELTDDAQAKIYELKIGVWDYNGTGECDLVDAGGDKMFHFVLNDCIVEDNRIPPLGFVPDQETAPVGYTYPNNPMRPGTLANWDDTNYMVPIPITASGDVLVRATLYYQSTSSEYMDFLVRENRSTCDPSDGCDPTMPSPMPNRSEKAYDMWDRHGRSGPVEVASATATIDVMAAPPGPCCVGATCFENVMPPDCASLGGRFDGVEPTCATVDCTPPVEPAPGEASDVLDGAVELLVTGWDDMAGELSVSFEPACDATQHGVYWGDLARVGTYAYVGTECAVGTSGTASFMPGDGSVFFLVVGKNASAEGPYGTDSLGTERPESLALSPCDFPQDLSATCR